MPYTFSAVLHAEASTTSILIQLQHPVYSVLYGLYTVSETVGLCSPYNVRVPCYSIRLFYIP